jgi:4-amino-4-deoxy-L-arabinose transferase-like glycosyltransferase
MTEILGWVATALVLLSFTIQDMRKLRLVNMLGCILWIGYGFILMIKPVIFVNMSILIIHSYWLIKNKSR